MYYLINTKRIYVTDIMKFYNKMNNHKPTAQPKNYPIFLPSPGVTNVLSFFIPLVFF